MDTSRLFTLVEDSSKFSVDSVFTLWSSSTSVALVSSDVFSSFSDAVVPSGCDEISSVLDVDFDNTAGIVSSCVQLSSCFLSYPTKMKTE